MSIVLRGIGIAEIDSGSSIVAFGIARDLSPGETVAQAVSSAGIESLFVIDYGTGRRRANSKEHRRFKRIAKLMADGNIIFRETKDGKGFEYWAERKPKGYR